MKYTEFIQNSAKPQPIGVKVDPAQVANNAGGFTFETSKWQQLVRFLKLGSTGGTYYVGADKLTAMNFDIVKECIAEDATRTVQIIEDVSFSGQTMKNDTAVVALALCLHSGNTEAVRAAQSVVSHVCRTGTDILHLGSYLDGLKGWGRAKRRAIANWYLGMPAGALAFQVTKYQSRDGWSHTDLLRLAHVNPGESAGHAAVLNYVVKGVQPELVDEVWSKNIWAFERAKLITDKAEMIAHIKANRLPREMVPTEWLKDPDIQAAMLPSLGYKAILRNLGNYSKSGVMDKVKDEVVAKLTDNKAIVGSRIHPIDILVSMKQYMVGHGLLGKGSWDVEKDVTVALMDAFSQAFVNVPSTGKRILVAVDTSGSMGTDVNGAPNVTCSEAASALAMVIYDTEPRAELARFDNVAVMDTYVTRRTALPDIMNAFRSNGGTNVGSVLNLAMQEVRKGRDAYDAIIILTDGETWLGNQVHQMMEMYRAQAKRPDAKLIMVAAQANRVSVIDPRDKNSLVVAGFDASVPVVIADFIVN